MIQNTLCTATNQSHKYHLIYLYVIEIIFEYTYQSLPNKLSTISICISTLGCANIRIYPYVYATLLIFPMGNLSHFRPLLNTPTPSKHLYFNVLVFANVFLKNRFPTYIPPTLHTTVKCTFGSINP